MLPEFDCKCCENKKLLSKQKSGKNQSGVHPKLTHKVWRRHENFPVEEIKSVLIHPFCLDLPCVHFLLFRYKARVIPEEYGTGDRPHNGVRFPASFQTGCHPLQPPTAHTHSLESKFPRTHSTKLTVWSSGTDTSRENLSSF